MKHAIQWKATRVERPKAGRDAELAVLNRAWQDENKAFEAALGGPRFKAALKRLTTERKRIEREKRKILAFASKEVEDGMTDTLTWKPAAISRLIEPDVVTALGNNLEPEQIAPLVKRLDAALSKAPKNAAAEELRAMRDWLCAWGENGWAVTSESGAARSVSHPLFGALPWDFGLDGYEYTWSFGGRRVFVSMSVNESAPAPVLERAASVVELVMGNDPELRRAAAAALHGLYEEEWRRDGPSLTPAEMAEELVLVEIWVSEAGAVGLRYDSGNVFAGHRIHLELDGMMRPIRSELD